METTVEYQLIHLPYGACSIRSLASAETFHPVVGAAEEARTLYAEQLQLAKRLSETQGEFVIWDIGLGGAANACAALNALGQAAALSGPRPIRVLSFDRTAGALAFGFQHRIELGYFRGFETVVESLLATGEARFQIGGCPVHWTATLSEIPALLGQPAAGRPAPHAILFDPCSPGKNPEMWTLPFLALLHRQLDPARPCNLATYSRSTMIRVSFLLAGFFVGSGQSIGEKEETTVAANDVALLAAPLDLRWLDRARRSGAAEPMHGPIHRQAPLNPETWEKLKNHPQFNR